MRIPCPTKKLAVTFAVALVAACGGGDTGSTADPVSARAANPGSAANKLSVMTRNLYIGGAVEPFFLPGVTPEMIPGLAAELWANVQATSFPERAEAIADEIAASGAALVGLQEVALFRTQFPGDAFSPTGVAATTVAYDFLALLLDALERRGLSYEVVTVRDNIDVEVFTVPGFLDVRLTDRDAILARSDVDVLATDGATFQAAISVPLGGATVNVVRGWSSARVSHQGLEFLFVNTHLEPFSPIVQGFQAAELFGELAGETLPVVLVGDLNSAPGESTYELFTANGYVDAFVAAPPGGPAFTCCQAEDLLNEVSILDERVDHVLVGGAALVPQMTVVVGSYARDRTAGGLWPSDHAGVAARLKVVSP
jgi:endonuclease/exonuclease/phosphatase family metal-dependent hydrolase